MLREINDNELDIIYSFFVDNSKDKRLGGGAYTEVDIGNGKKAVEFEHGNLGLISAVLTYFLIDMKNKNAFPKVLNDEIYNQLRDVVTVYRGEEKPEYAKTLLDGITYHYGDGVYGDGIYTTDRREKANTYACPDRYTAGCLTEFKIDPNASVIDYSHLLKIGDYLAFRTSNIKKKFRFFNKKECEKPFMTEEVEEKLNKLIDFIIKKQDENFRFCFMPGINSGNALAVYLGFDVLKNQLDNEVDYIVLNRNSLCVSQGEYDRIMGESVTQK